MSNVLGELEDGLPEIGDEPIIAWRQWGISSGDLVSMNQKPWPYRAPLEGECVHARDEKSDTWLQVHADGLPASDCTCGIYAAKSLAQLGLAGYSIDGLRDKERVCFGTVKLWGRLVAHERGFRAQYAYPEHVWVSDPVYAQLIEHNYGCQVTVIKQPPKPQPPAATSPVEGDAAISHAINTNISCIVNGVGHLYQGPCDPVAVGRWFAGIIGQHAGQFIAYPSAGGRIDYAQLQISFWKPNV